MKTSNTTPSGDEEIPDGFGTVSDKEIAKIDKKTSPLIKELSKASPDDKLPKELIDSPTTPSELAKLGEATFKKYEIILKWLTDAANQAAPEVNSKNIDIAYACNFINELQESLLASCPSAVDAKQLEQEYLDKTGHRLNINLIQDLLTPHPTTIIDVARLRNLILGTVGELMPNKIYNKWIDAPNVLSGKLDKDIDSIISSEIAVTVCRCEELDKEDWLQMGAKARHKFNLMDAEIAQLQTEMEKLTKYLEKHKWGDTGETPVDAIMRFNGNLIGGNRDCIEEIEYLKAKIKELQND